MLRVQNINTKMKLTLISIQFKYKHFVTMQKKQVPSFILARSKDAFLIGVDSQFDIRSNMHL